jgi:hypothetical protein
MRHSITPSPPRGTEWVLSNATSFGRPSALTLALSNPRLAVDRPKCIDLARTSTSQPFNSSSEALSPGPQSHQLISWISGYEEWGDRSRQNRMICLSRLTHWPRWAADQGGVASAVGAAAIADGDRRIGCNRCISCCLWLVKPNHVWRCIKNVF